MIALKIIGCIVVALPLALFLFYIFKIHIGQLFEVLLALFIVILLVAIWIGFTYLILMLKG